jgi:hypothetical protein
MLDQLDAQLAKLDEFARVAFVDRRDDFLPEVATKLRLLVVHSRHNKALLFEVANAFGISPVITLGGPPGIPIPHGTRTMRAGDILPLDDFFDLEAFCTRTSSGLVTMTKRELIRAWSEQLGGAHADWAVDEALQIAVGARVHLFGVQATAFELRSCARVALEHGRDVVHRARATPAGNEEEGHQ